MSTRTRNTFAVIRLMITLGASTLGACVGHICDAPDPDGGVADTRRSDTARGPDDAPAADSSVADAAVDAPTTEDVAREVDAATPDVTTAIDATLADARPATDAATADTSAAPDARPPVDASGTDAATPAARPIGPRVRTFTESGPIVARSGQRITGLHITSRSGPCIIATGVSDVHIEDNEIGPCGAPGDREGIAVESERAHDIFIEHNYIHDVASAFYALDGGANMVFDHNRVGSVYGPLPRGQMVQFNEVHGGGSRVTCNIHDQANLTGYYAEDHINLYRSGGTAGGPMEVGYNRIRGYSGGSTSGCGILLGDEGGSYVNAHDNVIVNPGGCGFGIASGHDIHVTRTHVFMPAGEPYAEIGAYIWNQYSYECTNNDLIENRTYAIRRSGTANHFWNAGNCSSTTLRDNTWGDASLTAAIFDVAYPECD